MKILFLILETLPDIIAILALGWIGINLAHLFLADELDLKEMGIFWLANKIRKITRRK